MKTTTRRNLLKFAAASGVSALALPVTAQPKALAHEASAEAQSHGHQATAISGPLAEATMSFGQWTANATVDRMRVANPGASNTHLLVPNEVKIQAGGAVNFIIAGFHQVLIYDNGTQPGDIDADLRLPAPLAALIDDQSNLIYRGLSPSGVPANFFAAGVPAAAITAPPQDRVETVQFLQPGTYLVICGVAAHFMNGMYGYVTVLP